MKIINLICKAPRQATKEPKKRIITICEKMSPLLFIMHLSTYTATTYCNLHRDGLLNNGGGLARRKSRSCKGARQRGGLKVSREITDVVVGVTHKVHRL